MKEEFPGQEIVTSNRCDRDDICVSVISRTFIFWPESKLNRYHLERTIAQAKKMLKTKYSQKHTFKLIDALDELSGIADFNTNGKGIAIFVSATTKRLIHFHFPVHEKVLAVPSFATRDLIYQSFYFVPYFVLLLTRQGAILYRGLLNKLDEINDEHFPRKHDDDYEYNSPVHGSSFMGRTPTKQFEREKCQMIEKHTIDLFKETDNNLTYYVPNQLHLVLVGTEENVSLFKSLTIQTQNIAGSVNGNFTHTPRAEWAHLT